MNTLLKFLSDLILGGKIPQKLITFTQKILLFLAIIPIIGILFLPMDYRNLGEFSWNLLLPIVFLRPISDIFSEFKILKRLLPLRKEAGILCGSLGIAHSIGFFMDGEIPINEWFVGAQYWDITQYYFWGILALIIMVLLTLTSNIFCIRILKKHWKQLHRLVYFLVIFIALHVVLIARSKGADFMDEKILMGGFVIVFLPIVLFLSKRKFNITFFKS